MQKLATDNNGCAKGASRRSAVEPSSLSRLSESYVKPCQGDCSRDAAKGDAARTLERLEDRTQ